MALNLMGITPIVIIISTSNLKNLKIKVIYSILYIDMTL